MPLYRYRAVSAADEVIEGEMEARSQAAVIERLQELGHLPIRADEIAPGKSGSLLQRDLFANRKVSRRVVALVTSELATMLGAGLPLDQALSHLRSEPPGDVSEAIIANMEQVARAEAVERRRSTTAA